MDTSELLPSRVSDCLFEALADLEETIVEEARTEEEENSGQPCTYEEAQDFVESWRRNVKALIDGRTSWLVHTRTDNPDVMPAWFLDFQRELAEIDMSLEEMFARYDAGGQETLKEMRAALDRRRYIANLVREVEKELNVHVPN